MEHYKHLLTDNRLDGLATVLGVSAESLNRLNIGCAIYYPCPMHLQECFRNLGYKFGDFPEAEKASKEVLAIPIYPELTSDMQNYVADKVISFVEQPNISICKSLV